MSRGHRFLPALAATVVLMTASACASGGYYRGSAGYPADSRQINDRAYRNGFEDGRRNGESDARRGLRADYGRHDDYRSANWGYGGSGNRNAYRDTFRQGFVAGYNEGYRQNVRGDSRRQGPNVYDRGGQVYGSVAAQNGFRDGIEQGQRDRRDGHRFDPVRASRYREGDHDYNSRYGSRDDYKRDYRSAFQQGYAQGYGR